MPDKRVTELTAIDAVTDTDIVMVIDDPAGTPVNKKATVTQVLVNTAKTNASNTFSGDQTVDGDLFVTGEVNPVVLARQKAKIDLFTGVSPGDPVGSRTVMSQSLISGLALRHDEALSIGRISVGNYDAQLYQPLLFECEEFQVHTGVSPGTRVERLRVHPSGGVTVGANHIDPGEGSVAAATFDLMEAIVPLDPPVGTGRLYALDVNGYTQIEMRDGNANAVRFASDNIMVAKVSGVAITRGQCLYIVGAAGANPLVGLARADAIATMPAIGLALDSGVVNAFVRVLLLGTFQLLDTSAFSEGDRLYVSPVTAGALTITRPDAYAQRVGVVTRSHATQGEMLVLTTAVESAGSALPPNVAYTDAANLFTQTQTMQGVIATDAYFNSLGATPLNADSLTSGTIPDARLSANVQMKPATLRIGHTWALVGDVSALTTLPPMFIPQVGTQVSRLVEVRAKIASGTSVTAQVKRNGINVGSAVTVTSAATTTALGNVALAADDELSLLLSSPVGTPTHFSATLIVEHTP